MGREELGRGSRDGHSAAGRGAALCTGSRGGRVAACCGRGFDAQLNGGGVTIYYWSSDPSIGFTHPGRPWALLNGTHARVADFLSCRLSA